jgi:transcriptional regulatory protein RtcR
MATLAPGGRITQTVLEPEMEHLRKGWTLPAGDSGHEAVLGSVLSSRAIERLDLFDQAQPAFVIRVCRQSTSLSEAGRKLLPPRAKNARPPTTPTGFENISRGLIWIGRWSG